MAGCEVKVFARDVESEAVPVGVGEGKMQRQQLPYGCSSPKIELLDGCNPKGVCPEFVDCSDYVPDDGDGLKRRGTVWSGAAMTMATILGSGVIGLPWSFAQLGWVGGCLVLLGLALLSWWTAILLCDLYRFMDPVSGRRLRSYPDAVSAYLGKNALIFCAVIQYCSLTGTCIGFTVTAANSMKSLQNLQCATQQESGHESECIVHPTWLLLTIFGLLQVGISQISNFSELQWLSSFSVLMSLTYSGIAIFCGLRLAFDDKSHPDHGNLTGLPIGPVLPEVNVLEKTFGIMNAIGAIAFTYDFNPLLFYIQDTLMSPPSENVTMKKSSSIGIGLTTLLYVFISVTGYAALGNNTPGDFWSGLANYHPHWLVGIANVAVVAQLAASFQIFCQPIFDVLERFALRKWPSTTYFRQSYELKLPILRCTWNFHGFRLTLRTAIICLLTFVAILIPFFNAILGFLGAVSLWPMTVFLPIAMHKKRTALRACTAHWIALELLSAATLLLSMGAAAGAMYSVISSLSTTPLFA